MALIQGRCNQTRTVFSVQWSASVQWGGACDGAKHTLPRQPSPWQQTRPVIRGDDWIVSRGVCLWLGLTAEGENLSGTAITVLKMVILLLLLVQCRIHFYCQLVQDHFVKVAVVICVSHKVKDVNAYQRFFFFISLHSGRVVLGISHNLKSWEEEPGYEASASNVPSVV